MELDKKALARGRRGLCKDAYRLFELAYIINNEKTNNLPNSIISKYKASNLTIISFEGINCAGKTTQIKRLFKSLKRYNPFISPRFYECVPANIIRSRIRGNFYQMYNPIVDSLLIASACIEKYQIFVKQNKRLILMDRSMDSLYVFQGRKIAEMGYSINESIEWLMNLVKSIDRDNYRFFFDIPLDEAIRRNDRRNNEENQDNGQRELTKEDVKELAKNIEMYKILDEEFNRGYIKINAKSSINNITQKILRNIDFKKIKE